MKTVGTYLLEHRRLKNLELDELSARTKIRKDFLKAIENDEFSTLPSAAFVKGFISSYATAVGADPKKALAIFRRDFDLDKAGNVVPRGMTQPIERQHKFWQPKTNTIFGMGVLGLLLCLYIGYQVMTLVSAPKLDITSPIQDSVVSTTIVDVEGKTFADASVTVNNQEVPVKSDGQFLTVLNLSPGSHTIVIEAKSRDGKVNRQTRTVTINSVQDN